MLAGLLLNEPVGIRMPRGGLETVYIYADEDPECVEAQAVVRRLEERAQRGDQDAIAMLLVMLGVME